MQTSHAPLQHRLTTGEWIVLGAVFLMWLVAMVLLYTQLPLFLAYTTEESWVEWMAVAGLLAGGIVCLARLAHGWGSKAWPFLLMQGILAAGLIFGAGEEISWGQRLLGFGTPDYFREFNTQNDTTLHNLKFGNFRINKWVFSLLLGAVLVVYMLLMPLLYRRSARVRRFVERSGIPLPKRGHLIAFIALLLAHEAIAHSRRAEVLEAGVAAILFLVMWRPANFASPSHPPMITDRVLS